MKNKISNFIIGGLILLILILTIFISNGGNFAVTDSGVKTDKGYYAINYGFLACKQSDLRLNKTYNDVGGEQVITCQQFGTLLQGCDISIHTPTKAEVSSFGISGAGIIYNICTQGQVCDSVSNRIPLTSLGFTYSDNIDAVKNIGHLEPNQYLKIAYVETSLTFQQSNPTKLDYTVYYNPFFINKIDNRDSSSYTAIPNTIDCDYNAIFSEKQDVITKVLGGGDLSAKLSSQLKDISYIRAVGAVVPYVSSLDSVSPTYRFSADGTKYCTNKQIYAVETVETTSYIYHVANTNTNKVIGTADCCVDGDLDINKYYCDANFKAQPLNSNDISCALRQCPLVGYRSVSDGTMAYQICNDQKICETKSLKVACNEFSGCASGSYCEVDKVNPQNNVCKSGVRIDACGNDVCDAGLGESFSTCPSDCPKKQDLSNIIIYVLLIFVAIIVLMIVVKKRMKK